MADIREDDVAGKRYGSDGRYEEEDDGDGRVAEDGVARLYPHDERRADNQGRQQYAERDAVGYLLNAFEQALLVYDVGVNLYLVVGDHVQELIDASRQPLQKVLRLYHGGEDVAGRERLHHALLHDLGGVAAYGGVDVEAGATGLDRKSVV